MIKKSWRKQVWFDKRNCSYSFYAWNPQRKLVKQVRLDNIKVFFETICINLPPTVSVTLSRTISDPISAWQIYTPLSSTWASWMKRVPRSTWVRDERSPSYLYQRMWTGACWRKKVITRTFLRWLEIETYVVDNIETFTVELCCLTDLNDLDLRCIDNDLDRWWSDDRWLWWRWCWVLTWETNSNRVSIFHHPSMIK